MNPTYWTKPGQIVINNLINCHTHECLQESLSAQSCRNNRSRFLPPGHPKSADLTAVAFSLLTLSNSLPTVNQNDRNDQLVGLIQILAKPCKFLPVVCWVGPISVPKNALGNIYNAVCTLRESIVLNLRIQASEYQHLIDKSINITTSTI